MYTQSVNSIAYCTDNSAVESVFFCYGQSKWSNESFIWMVTARDPFWRGDSKSYNKWFVFGNVMDCLKAVLPNLEFILGNEVAPNISAVTTQIVLSPEDYLTTTRDSHVWVLQVDSVAFRALQTATVTTSFSFYLPWSGHNHVVSLIDWVSI